jgi:hypothetical protein
VAKEPCSCVNKRICIWRHWIYWMAVSWI